VALPAACLQNAELLAVFLLFTVFPLILVILAVILLVLIAVILVILTVLHEDTSFHALAYRDYSAQKQKKYTHIFAEMMLTNGPPADILNQQNKEG
jgi:hypothetical protein